MDKNKRKYKFEAKQINLFSRIIIVILVIGMILGHFNLGIIAKAFDEKEHIIITNDIQKDFSEVENIDEVISLRTENTKTFIKDNGMYETSYYGEKIHYYKNNEWIEIDNTLKVKDNKYHNNSNRFDVSFPIELSSNNKVTLNYLNNEVKIYYDVNNVSSVLNENINRNSSNLKDKISYEISNREKIEYIINQDSIKENIILNSYITNYEYSYYIDTDLRIERIGDRLYFYNGLEEIYVMNEYYMYDHDGNYSYDIDFTIETIDNDTYKVNVTPSDSFLKGASYPVTVDPEIVIQNGGYLDNIYNVTSLDMNTNTLLNRSIGTFNVNNRVSSNQDDDLKAYFDVLLPKTYTIGNVYNSIGKNQLMYANIILPTTNTSISGETEVILKEVVEFDNIELDYSDTDTFDLDYIDSEYIHSTSSFDHSFNVYNLVKSKLDLLETSDVHLKFEVSVSGNNNSSITYSLGGDLTGYKPKLVIGYLSDAGLADYYTYEELPISDNSDAYIAHNSGNLTYIYNDYNDNNLLNFSHIYNDNRKDINNGYGNGFSINYNEFITTYTYDERLLLTKGDGREVIYYSNNEENTEYSAGDGSGDVLRKVFDDGGNLLSYEIETYNDELKIYNISGKLTKIYMNINDREDGVWDESSKYISLFYNSNNSLLKVLDSEGNYIYFTYNNLMLSEVNCYKKIPYIDFSGPYLIKKINFTYQDSNLISLIETENQFVFDEASECFTLNGTISRTENLIYDSKNHIICAKEVYSNKEAGFTFLYDNQNRVINAKVHSDCFINGDYLDFSYNTNGKKTIITNGLNQSISYTFDDYYHTTSIEDNNGYTTFYKYEDIYYDEFGLVITQPNYDLNHKIKVQSNRFKNVANLINNHGFELIGSNNVIPGWEKDLTGLSQATIDTTLVLYGTKVLKLYKSQNGTCKVYQDVLVEANKEYIVTGYIKNTNSSGGAYIDVTGVTASVNEISSTESITNSKDFCMFEYKFTSSTSGYVRINLVNEANGYVYFDNIQINTNYLDTRYNYLNNSSFENGEISYSGEGYLIVDNEYFNENALNKSLKLLNDGEISQTLDIYGTSGDVLVFGGYCFYENYTGSVSFSVTIETEENIITKEFTFDDNDKNSNYYMDKIIVPYNYYSVELKVRNNTNSSYAYLDNLAIYKEGYGINISYTEDGKIEEEYNELTNESTEYGYNEETGNLESIVTNNSSTEIGYNDKNYINRIETNNVTSSYELDENGNIESVTVEAENSEESYNSGSTSFSDNGLYPETNTDIFGTVTTYTYDYIKGLVTNINTQYQKDGQNININDSYTYDSYSNKLSDTKSSGSSSKTVMYTYDELGNLTSIIDNKLKYVLTYNDYGSLDKITAIDLDNVNNSIQLIDYNYINENSFDTNVYNDSYTGEVDNIEYNYGTIYFDYNDLNQIDKIYYNSKTENDLVLSYLYNDYGEISSYTDYLEDVTYYYNYDYQNRIININASNGNNFKYAYDNDSNLVSKVNINGTNTYIYEDLNEEDEIDSKVLTNEYINNIYYKSYDYTINAFEKLESINYYIDTINETPTISESFVYEKVEYNDEETNTGRIKEAIYVLDEITFRYVYDYDIYNNIINITRYRNNVIDYEEHNTYDIFNQLIEQIYSYVQVPIKMNYTYDINGNITSIIKTNIEKDEVSSTTTLTYNNLNELIQVNDNGKIYNNTYNNGKLVNYMGWFIEHDMRNISSMENRDTLVSYQYNANGIRTSKIVDGVNTTYLLDGQNIIRETKNGVNGYTINYYYDINDSIIGFSYAKNNNLNNIYYYMYLKNIQNDIIGIVDFNGNLVVEYIYDAYGNIINIIDESNLNIGTINPFRYRSYYFDTETNWYYLNSRYYNPKLGRFVTMDEVECLGASGSLLSYNLYSYCEGNPVNNIDDTGYYSKKVLFERSWLFELANIFGINISDDSLSEPIKEIIFAINVYLIKLELSISVGLAINYKAGISFNYTKSSIGVSTNVGLGKGYSICYAYTLKWNKIIRSMSIVYCAADIGLFVSLNLDFEIRHIATAALAVACVYVPQFAPVLPKLVLKSPATAVTASLLLVPIMRAIYKI